MSYVPLEEILDKSGGSLYKLVNAASKRALELAEGAQILAEEAKAISKPTMKALLEIRAGKISYALAKKKKGS